MKDEAIVQLFVDRNERAISAADDKYGRGCRKIAMDVLGNPQDAEETVNEMWLRVWNAIPPAKPENLFAFLSATVRNCALNRVTANHSQRRGGGVMPQALEELSFCVAGSDSVEGTVDYHLLLASVEQFLDALSPMERAIFVERYTNLRTSAEIAAEFRITESRVRVTLMRTRKKLKTYLKKEGFL